MRPFTPKKPSKLWHSQVAAAEDDQQPKQVQKATKATVGNFMLSRSTKPLTMPIEFNFSSRLDAKKKLAVSAATAVVVSHNPKTLIYFARNQRSLKITIVK